MSSRTYLSIGDVLSLLREEFSDVTISKIRFLESQGLVNPERSASGYRKFYEHDVERLRWVLRQQRENFLPLKVIRDRLANEGEGDLTDDGAEVAPDDAPGDDGAPAHEPDAEHFTANGSAEAPATLPEVPAMAYATSTPAPAPTPRPATAMPGVSRPDEAVSDRASAPTRLVDPAPPVAPERQPRAGSAVAAATARPQTRPGTETPRPTAAAAAKPDQAATSKEPAKGRSAKAERSTSAPRPTVSRPEAPMAPDADFSYSGGVSGASLTVDELCAASGLSETDIASLEGYGLVQAITVAGILCYDEEALTVARLVADFAHFGIEPRHLRTYRNAVEREMGLVEQIVTPLLRQRNPEARQRAVDAATALAKLGQSLHASLLRRELHRQLGG